MTDDDHLLDDIQSAIYDLIKRFVERQQLPYEVIKKYRPRWVGLSTAPYNKEYMSATQWGRWGEENEWVYFLHGVGCRLTHTVTGEVIDWDAADLNRFGKYSFVWWLRTLLKQDVADKSLSLISVQVNVVSDAFEQRICDVIEQLCKAGKLRQYEYVFTNYVLLA